MKIKSIKLWLAIALIPMTYTACNHEKLDWTPLGETEGSFFTEENHFERGTLGIYAKLTDMYWYGNSGNPGFSQRIWLLPGDDVTVTGTDPFEVFENLTPGNGNLSFYYQTLYRIISRANTMIQTIDQRGQGVYTTQGLMEHNKGEAFFLRGYANFMLSNVFCSSPLVTERITEQSKIQPSGSTGNQLLDQAIADFQAAETLLPPNWSEANRGRATKSSARGYLGKALVYRGSITNSTADYTAAIAAFNRITDKSLVTRFADNFAARRENNSESLFEFQANNATGGGNDWLANDFDNPIGSIAAYYGYFSKHWSLFGQPYNGTVKLYNAFHPLDPRRDATVKATTDSENPLQIQKYWTQDARTSTDVSSMNNTRMLRYADVLLLKAEAIVKSGGPLGDAVALINEVRTRARNSGTTPSVEPANRPGSADANTVMQWVRDERFLELAAEEGNRWFDLRRWHLGGQLDLATWDFSSITTGVAFRKDRHLCFPIPNAELDLNPNVIQNPNY